MEMISKEMVNRISSKSESCNFVNCQKFKSFPKREKDCISSEMVYSETSFSRQSLVRQDVAH